MPWLVGTALMHSLAVTEKRGTFKAWTVLLAILAFCAEPARHLPGPLGRADLGARLRHRPARGVFILAFLGAGDRRLAGAVRLARAARSAPGGSFALVSRESMLLANNVLLVVAAAAVLLGTLYPLVLDALELGKISVGPPYFEAVFVPADGAARCFLVGVGPIARWREAALPDLAKRLRWALGVAVVGGIAAAAHRRRLQAAHRGLGLLFGIWIVATVPSTGVLVHHARRRWAAAATPACACSRRRCGA
jgi:cytochrome c-type biogenesis protein CcmF